LGEHEIKYIITDAYNCTANLGLKTRIRVAPGGSQLGWTTIGTPDNGWVKAIHTLDELKDQTDVKLRMAYGSDGSSNVRDGIAFDDIWIGDRNRNVLLEHFTNITDVSSSNANALVNTITDNKKEDVINIQYHTNFSGTDPYFSDNPADASARILFYGLTRAPYTFIDGGTKTDFALYPNPAVNKLTIVFEELLPREADIRIYDMRGVVIALYRAVSGILQFSIDDLKLKGGIYLVRITSGAADLGFKKLIVSGD